MSSTFFTCGKLDCNEWEGATGQASELAQVLWKERELDWGLETGLGCGFQGWDAIGITGNIPIQEAGFMFLSASQRKQTLTLGSLGTTIQYMVMPK